MFSIFMIANFIGQMFAKDFESKFYNILFTKPITKFKYISGRAMGNFTLVCLVFVTSMILYEIGLHVIPGIQSDIILQTNILWYVSSILTSILPNIIIIGSFFVAVVIMTKRTNTVFIAIFIILIVSGIASTLLNKLDNQILSALLDPFGFEAMTLSVKGWNVNDLNTQIVGFSYLHIINRLIWLAISVALFIISIVKFNFEFTFRDSKKKIAPQKTTEAILQRTLPTFMYIDDFQTKLLQLKTSFVWNLRLIFRSVAFWWILVLSVIFLAFGISMTGMAYGTKVLPVTYHVVDALFAGFIIIFLIIITYFTGELVWASRENYINQIEDCLPVNTFLSFFSKFSAMFVFIATFFGLMILVGIMFQAISGYFNFEVGLYLKLFLLNHFLGIILLLLLVFFIHTIVNHKYASHFAFILFFAILPLLYLFKIEHPLLIPLFVPSFHYSDMSRFGNGIPEYVWWSIYSYLIMLIFTGVTVMNWKVGLQQSYWKNYLKKLKTKPALIYNITLVSLAILIGGNIYWHTNIDNTYLTRKKIELRSVYYESRYSHLKRVDQPKITDIEVFVDIFPETRELEVRGRYIIKNNSQSCIDTLVINFPRSVNYTKRVFSGDNTPIIVSNDDFFSLNLYSFSEPLAPGDSLTLDFEFTSKKNRFGGLYGNRLVQKNGTLLYSNLFPSIGYSESPEIFSERRRKHYGLPEKDLMPPVDDPWGLTRNYVSGDADWISFRATVSTSADQIALAPGELVASWTEESDKSREPRNYFQYQMTSNMLNFFTFLSARYEVKRDRWNGIDLEIYYHKPHTYNLDNLMAGMKQSLSYYTEVLGPYHLSVLRIAEFPRFGYYAQAFPGLIPFSEGVGFIADIDDSSIDYAFSITAHEVGHQWWAHQMIGGWTRGSIMLTESFTEYISLMVVKRRFSDKLFREKLAYTHNSYISSRSYESKVELPLTQVEVTQSYIVYNKGLLKLHATSRILGEDTLNTALREYIDLTRFTANPYSNTLEFMAVLDRYVPEEYKSVIHEMFNMVVLYDHQIKNATSEEIIPEYKRTSPKNYTNTIEFTTEKRIYDADGIAEPVVYTGWLEIALLDSDGKLIHIERVLISERENIVVIESNEKPAEVIIDPYFQTMSLSAHQNRKKI
jgi:hypothetical protein